MFWRAICLAFYPAYILTGISLSILCVVGILFYTHTRIYIYVAFVIWHSFWQSIWHFIGFCPRILCAILSDNLSGISSIWYRIWHSFRIFLAYIYTYCVIWSRILFDIYFGSRFSICFDIWFGMLSDILSGKLFGRYVYILFGNCLVFFLAYRSGFGPKIVELAISGNPRPFGCELRGMGKALRRLVFLSALCWAVCSRTCLPEAWTVHQPACLVVGVNAHKNWTVVPTHVVLNSYVGRWKAMTCISHVVGVSSSCVISCSHLLSSSLLISPLVLLASPSKLADNFYFCGAQLCCRMDHWINMTEPLLTLGSEP